MLKSSRAEGGRGSGGGGPGPGLASTHSSAQRQTAVYTSPLIMASRLKRFIVHGGPVRGLPGRCGRVPRGGGGGRAEGGTTPAANHAAHVPAFWTSQP